MADAFDHSLKLDINGACYVVYPDCAIFRAPNATPGCVLAMVGVGHIAKPLGIKDFTLTHVILVFGLIMMLLGILFAQYF